MRFWWIAALGACTSGKASSGEDTEGGDADTDADTDGDGDTDADTDADTGEIREPGAETFIATTGNGTFDGDPGHWVSAGTSSTIKADQNGGEINFELTVAGDASAWGTYSVSTIVWAKSIAQAGFEYYYTGSGGGVTFTVDAMDEERDRIWGSISGPVTVTDTVGGGSTVVESLVVESWPRFGT